MQLSPHLTFDGNCRAAFTAYSAIFQQPIKTMLSYGDSPMASQVDAQWHQRIVHATLPLGVLELTGTDVPSNDYKKPQGFFVTLTVTDPSQGSAIFTALAAGGIVQLPYAQTFWSPGFGIVVDRFGVPWEINTEGSSS